MAQKPSIPKGTRDFSPLVMNRRNYIFNTIEKVFKLYGFSQIETPAMENLSVLMGKYGDEGDKLLFKVLNSGDFLSKVDDDLLKEKNPIKLTNKISEKGLRYDLTVPFARYVVQHQNEITFPFKRYQIQPVWRADRPQKGRYREFYQCDVDVIGSDSLLNEIEIIKITDEVFSRLDLNITIKINNRKILQGIAESFNQPDKIIDIAVAIDKLDKIGIDKVAEELKQNNINTELINFFKDSITKNNFSLESLSKLFSEKNSETGLKGIEELQFIEEYLSEISLKKAKIEFDFSLARGLNYYTGAIFEVKSNDVEIGSITGGGRYDNLSGVFGLKNVSGVGISFGADRIYDVIDKLDKFPKNIETTTTVLFVNFGKTEQKYCLKLIEKVRENNINAELYPSSVKLKKQISYANNKNIPYVALIGENEMAENKITLKNMQTGEQTYVDINKLIDVCKNI